MRTKLVLTTDDARQIVAAARAEAERNDWQVSIVVVDDGGCPLALERLDGAFPHSAEIALAKARTAATMRLPTKLLEDMATNRPVLMTMARVTRVQGCLPIKSGDDCVGAIGVSGATSPQDEQVAMAGVAALVSNSPP